MGYLDLSYDPDEDVLEVTFTVFDEHFARTVTLNDNIFLFTDLSAQNAWGLTFYSYQHLLQVSETEFTALKDLPEEQVAALLSLLSRRPAALFFDLTDPESLIARVLAPRLAPLLFGDAAEEGSGLFTAG
jgi:hypothetical protein